MTFVLKNDFWGPFFERIFKYFFMVFNSTQFWVDGRGRPKNTYFSNSHIVLSFGTLGSLGLHPLYFEKDLSNSFLSVQRFNISLKRSGPLEIMQQLAGPDLFFCKQLSLVVNKEGQRTMKMTIKIVRNHVKLGFSLRILYCVVDTGYGLGRSLGDCRPELPKGRKYQMVKTQTESHDRRPIV